MQGGVSCITARVGKDELVPALVHLVVLIARLGTAVLLVGVRCATPVVKDGDDGRVALLAREARGRDGARLQAEVATRLGLGGAEQGRGGGGGGTGLNDLAAAHVHRHHGREGGGRTGQRSDNSAAGKHGRRLCLELET